MMEIVKVHVSSEEWLDFCNGLSVFFTCKHVACMQKAQIHTIQTCQDGDAGKPSA